MSENFKGLGIGRGLLEVLSRSFSGLGKATNILIRYIY
jgi:hypothetical protein